MTIDQTIKSIFAKLLLLMAVSIANNVHAGVVTKTLGPLTAVVVDNVKGAPYVVYLHGYGGSGEAVYEDYLKAEISKSPELKKWNWIVPNSPNSGSWFSIENENQKIWQETLIPTRKALQAMLVDAKIDPANVVWAGFSQGAITAVDMVMHSQVSPKGLIVNSGIVFDSSDWKKISNQLKGVPFIMSHDVDDDILPFEEALKLEILLLKNGMIGKLEKIKSGHEIPRQFLQKSLGPWRGHASAHCLKFY